jgi:hypothetical protein
MSEVRKNISVYVRLRPNVDGEGASPPSGPESEIISTQQNKIIVQTPGQARKFEVDKVYPRSASVDQVRITTITTITTPTTTQEIDLRPHVGPSIR